MNVHHLELFYYVAKHGGISAAVRKIPYGIQQPAASGQMGKLEEEVGAKLFERSPFRLTVAGEKLFAHVQPFLKTSTMSQRSWAGRPTPELRVAGAELILRDHLPGVLSQLRKQFPGLRLSLRTIGFQSEVQDWLRDGADGFGGGLATDSRPPARTAGSCWPRPKGFAGAAGTHRNSGVKSCATNSGRASASASR